MIVTRRDFLRLTAAGAVSMGSMPVSSCWRLREPVPRRQSSVRMALNQWSLWSQYVGDTTSPDWWDAFARALRTDPASIVKGPLDPLDFPVLTRTRYGLDAIELEASLYYAHARDAAYWRRLRQRCDDADVTCLLIANVWAGNLATVERAQRGAVAREYHPWIDAAAILGCHSVMVNVNARRGDRQALGAAAIEELSALLEYSRKSQVGVLVENHGWYSSYVPWLIDIVRGVNDPLCKLTVDLGNFCRTWRGAECVDQQYDPYAGVALMLPYARAVSAKTIRFDAHGNETLIDYSRMLRIIRESGYRGYLGIEYAGDELPADEGIRKSIDLITRAVNG